MTHATDLKDLFANNKKWARALTRKDPAFFKKLSHLQTPRFLWIGCSDSRVPANEITGLMPGEMFVHRNVANIVVHTDLNCLSVLQYAVEILKVRHIIVCGHYGCGGVKAVFDGKPFGLIDNWLRHVQDVRDQHAQELNGIKDSNRRFRRLCELNVLEQAANVARTTVVADAWKRKQTLKIHAVIYDLKDGLLKSVKGK